jgi:hypothetical protein
MENPHAPRNDDIHIVAWVPFFEYRLSLCSRFHLPDFNYLPKLFIVELAKKRYLLNTLLYYWVFGSTLFLALESVLGSRNDPVRIVINTIASRRPPVRPRRCASNRQCALVEKICFETSMPFPFGKVSRLRVSADNRFLL